MPTVLDYVAGPTPATRSTGSPATRREPLLKPGWPLMMLFVGYPIWWLFGLASAMCFVAAAIMALQLVQRRVILTPRGFGWWLLFLAWVLVGVFVLQVDAPDAVSGGSNNRYITFAFRLAWYLGATVVMLYIGNLRRELSINRITGALSWMFVTVVAGGLLGVLVPHLDFPSVLEVFLPRRFTSISFVRQQIHPIIAQIYYVQGHINRRPSAPFAFANVWGLNYAVLLPFFVTRWFGRDAGWRRYAAPVVLLASIVPVVISQNRGMWISLLAVGLFLAVRYALAGRVRLLAALIGAIALIAAVVLLTPAGDVVQAKLTNATSNEVRASLGLQTVESVTKASPVVGLGTTRNLEGSFSSIAAGDSAVCPLCAPPALGTQGHLWLVVFAEGWGGLLFYLGFLGLSFVRHLRVRSDTVTLGMSVLLIHFVTMPFYDSIGPSLYVTLAAVGLLWRSDLDKGSGQPLRSALRLGPTLGGYLGMLRAHAKLIAFCLILGVAGGAAWQLGHGGTPKTATVSVLLPSEPRYVAQSSKPVTIDTEAQFASATAVENAMRAATSGQANISIDNLVVTATPNTRILHLSYTAPKAEIAQAAVSAAANALLQQRARNMQARQNETLKKLEERSTALNSAIKTVGTSIALLKSSTVHQTGPFGTSDLLRRTQQRLLGAAGQVNAQVAQATSAPLDVGHLVRAPVIKTDKGRWLVALSTGLMLGLLVGALLSLLRDSVTGRVRRARDLTELTGLPVLADVPKSMVGDSRLWIAEATSAARLFRAGSCLGVGGDETAAAVARRLNLILDLTVTSPQGARPAAIADPRGAGRLRGLPADQSVVLVTSSHSRIRSVIHARDGLELAGSTVAGLVVVHGDPEL